MHLHLPYLFWLNVSSAVAACVALATTTWTRDPDIVKLSLIVLPLNALMFGFFKLVERRHGMSLREVSEKLRRRDAEAKSRRRSSGESGT